MWECCIHTDTQIYTSCKFSQSSSRQIVCVYIFIPPRMEIAASVCSHSNLKRIERCLFLFCSQIISVLLRFLFQTKKIGKSKCDMAWVHTSKSRSSNRFFNCSVCVMLFAVLFGWSAQILFVISSILIWQDCRHTQLALSHFQFPISQWFMDMYVCKLFNVHIKSSRQCFDRTQILLFFNSVF